MKKLIALALLLVNPISNAQMFESRKTITCGETNLVLKSLASEEIDEHAVWVGISEDNKTRTAVLVNEKTLTWTVIQLDEKIACILSVGTNFKFKTTNNSKEKSL